MATSKGKDGSNVATHPQIKRGLPPVARADARLFILGSLPGDASLGASQYYAHPRNHFWKLVGAVVGEPLAALPYDQRLQHLQDHRVGLWDVIGSAVRPGSLDQSIRSAGHNLLADYFAGFPDLRAVAFNGATSAVVGRRQLTSGYFTLVDLPSSSPANTRAFEEKLESWLLIKQYL